MSLKTRLLTTAFILPVTGWLSVAAHAYDLSGSGDDDEATASVATSSGATAHASITIGGTPTNEDAALRIDSDVNVTIDGVITIRDRNSTEDDATLYDLNNAVGIKLDTALTGDKALRLEDGARIGIVELVGPSVDDDEDGYFDNDSDQDFIIEGSSAFAGNHRRIGVWVNAAMANAFIGESGSSIVVEGNAATAGDVAGVRIDAALADKLDLSTSVSMFGDKAIGVDINGTIAGTYRHRGNIDVRGEGGVGIDIGAAISGALLIESLVNATGYSSIPNGTTGGPRRGGEDTDDANEFDATRQDANPDERRRGGSALHIGADIAQGVLINGTQNLVVTKAENDSRTDIRDRRSDDDDDNDNVTALKIAPYHYDENRARGRVTSYGEADGEAALKITASLATSGATRETFLDTTNDDDDETADPYDSTAEFFYSHGLMNRGGIEADALYDAVKSGTYVIENKATAVLVDDNGGSETLHGGIYNSGTMSAVGYNSNAVAVDIRDIELTDGLRDDGSVFLNDGLVSASLSTHEKSYEGIEADSREATAVKIGSAVSFDVTGTPEFTNAGQVSAVSVHRQDSGDTTDDGDVVYETVNGRNAVAFDLSGIAGDFNLTQRLRVEDAPVANGANSAANPYRGGGDMDLDRAGDIGQDDDGNDINVADGIIDTRDVGAPLTLGDVRFGAGDNIFTVTAGSVAGKISFGVGNDELRLGNSMADDANDASDEDDDYIAPVSGFRGRIENGGGTLNITAGGLTDIDGEKTMLHFDGQEGVDLDDDGNRDAGYQTLQINNLTLGENAELRFTVNPNLLPASEPVLDVTNFTMGDDVTLSLDISRLVPDARQIILLQAGNDLTGYAADINDRAPEDMVYPYIYDVNLSIDDSGANDRLLANFALKDSDALGLNATQMASFQTVLDHFTGSRRLEAALTGMSEEDEFLTAYANLLPHYGDGTMKQLAGLAQSATGSVSQHLQIVSAGGRRGGDGWLQQFGDHRKQDASAALSTLSGTSFGMAFGFDMPVGFVDAIGGFAQMSFTSVNEKSASTNEVKAESFALGAYLSDTIGPLRYELNAATGDVTFDSRRGIVFNTLGDTVLGSWDGSSVSAAARVSYPLLDFRHLLNVEAGMDYFSLEQDGYGEVSQSAIDPLLAMQLGASEAEMTTHYVGLRGGFRSGGGSPAAIVWEPNYYLGYRMLGDYTPYEANANFAGAADGVNGFTLKGVDSLDDQAEIGFGIAAHNDYFAFEFNYRGQFGDDTQVHGGGLTVRLLF